MHEFIDIERRPAFAFREDPTVVLGYIAWLWYTISTSRRSYRMLVRNGDIP
jgi:hypothetical protein